MAKAKLGSGARFAKVQKSIQKEGYTKKEAGAIAAHIGREKYGAKKMAKLAAHGKKK